jgi:hypothetical protein
VVRVCRRLRISLTEWGDGKKKKNKTKQKKKKLTGKRVDSFQDGCLFCISVRLL